MSSVEQADLFLQYNRRKMAALFAVVVLVGGIALGLMLMPTGPAWRSFSRLALIPIALSIGAIALFAVRGRQWEEGSPELQVALSDEWRKTNMERSSRIALITVLVTQWPVALALASTGLPSIRVALAMAMATVTIALATQLGCFLFLDRE